MSEKTKTCPHCGSFDLARIGVGHSAVSQYDYRCGNCRETMSKDEVDLGPATYTQAACPDCGSPVYSHTDDGHKCDNCGAIYGQDDAEEIQVEKSDGLNPDRSPAGRLVDLDAEEVP